MADKTNEGQNSDASVDRGVGMIAGKNVVVRREGQQEGGLEQIMYGVHCTGF